MKQGILIIAGAVVAGAAAGAVGGYFFGRHHSKKIADFEIAQVKEAYRKMYEPKPTIDDLKKKLEAEGVIAPENEVPDYPAGYNPLRPEEWTEKEQAGNPQVREKFVDPRAEVDQQAYEELNGVTLEGSPAKVTIQAETVNVIDTGTIDAAFDPKDDEPYMVSVGDFHDGKWDNLEKLTLIYHTGDDVLVAEGAPGGAQSIEGIVDNVDLVVGEKNLTYFGHPASRSEDPDIIYVRNIAFGADYEIIRKKDYYHDGQE